MNAKAGDKLTLKARKRLAELMGGASIGAIPKVVIASSGVQVGQWVCIDCGEPLRNNWEATGHELENPAHRMAYRTVNGIEQA